MVGNMRVHAHGAVAVIAFACGRMQTGQGTGADNATVRGMRFNTCGTVMG
jgi:hypothetical protein